MSYSSSRRIAAEGAGAAFLLATVVGSGIMGERLAGGNDAIALLVNTLSTGAILVVLITMLAPISGAHLNPAVTTIFWMRKEIASPLAIAYVLAQIAGGVVGVFIAHLMFNLPLLEFSVKIRSGPAQWLAEWVATFGLVATILVTLKAKPSAIPIAVGLFITSAYWFTASTSFANPAVAIARSLSDTFAGIRPADVAPFVGAEFAGALSAFVGCRWLLAEQ